MIKARNICKSFGTLEVIKGVDLDIYSGEIACIVGASGAGKSTLLQILGTIEKADKGSVSIAGQDTSKLNNKMLSAFRNKKIGFIFQFHHLLSEFTALENVCIPAFISGISKQEATKKAAYLLDYLGLSDRNDHKPAALSGGEQQRVAVARALINNPAVVLADEPSGNLDSQSAADLHRLFFNLRDEMKQTFVIVTHNNQLADMADRKLTIVDGLIQ
ncbi:MAG: ABC transporter ATP-binding protein [Lentimicrobiaceae bacterium]|jgi:lipoprotein-releasing system ATP-binding protein|nr:ABC transporter ATP-binding protein [Lentimicrobiaceae bacterium]